jgi:hypothetical protein
MVDTAAGIGGAKGDRNVYAEKEIKIDFENIQRRPRARISVGAGRPAVAE